MPLDYKFFNNITYAVSGGIFTYSLFNLYDGDTFVALAGASFATLCASSALKLSRYMNKQIKSIQRSEEQIQQEKVILNSLEEDTLDLSLEDRLYVKNTDFKGAIKTLQGHKKGTLH